MKMNILCAAFLITSLDDTNWSDLYSIHIIAVIVSLLYGMTATFFMSNCCIRSCVAYSLVKLPSTATLLRGQHFYQRVNDDGGNDCCHDESKKLYTRNRKPNDFPWIHYYVTFTTTTMRLFNHQHYHYHSVSTVPPPILYHHDWCGV